MRIAPRILIPLALLLLPVIGLTAAVVTTVIQKGRAFNLATLQIPRGGTVRFDNRDQFLHQVYVETPNFNFESDEQEPGTSIDILFTKAGLFEVRCHIHPKMLLQVEVH